MEGSFARHGVLAAFWREYFCWGKSALVKMERVFTCQNSGTSSEFLHLLLQQFNSALPETEVHQVWLHSGRSCGMFGLRKIHMSPGELLCGRNRWKQTLRVYTGMSRDLKSRTRVFQHGYIDFNYKIDSLHHPLLKCVLCYRRRKRKLEYYGVYTFKWTYACPTPPLSQDYHLLLA